MIGDSFFSSRSQKESTLKDIINNLSISESEKEIYILSLGILDDTDFETFYSNITSKIGGNNTYSIEPLSSTIL